MNFDITENVAVSLVATLAVIDHIVVGLRAKRCDPASASSHFVVAFVLFVIGVLVYLDAVSAVVGYGMLCLTLVSVYLFDMLREEHTRRRRVASLTPRPSADVVPTFWVAITVLSLLMLAPYVILGEQRVAALMVGLCSFVMAGIAWRIASAPMQLEGGDIERERLRNRVSRSREVGLTAVVAIGNIFVFVCFVNAGLPAVLPLQSMLIPASFLIWVGTYVWVTLYRRRLNSLASSAS